MASALAPIVNAIVGFLPWIVYWALIGSVPFRVAVVVAVLISVVVTFRPRRKPPRHTGFEIGTAICLLVLLVVSFATDGSALQRWIQPITTGCLFLVAGVLQLMGRPFTLPYAQAAVDEKTRRLDGFVWINRMMSAVWCVTFAVMTLISAIPPLVQGSATSSSGGSLLSILCYWVLPFTLAGLTGVACGVFPGWFADRLKVAQTPVAVSPSPPPQQTLNGVKFADTTVHLQHPDPADRMRLGVADAAGTWWWSPWRPADDRSVDLLSELALARPEGVAEPDVFVPSPSREAAVVIADKGAARTTLPDPLAGLEVVEDRLPGGAHVRTLRPSAPTGAVVVLFPGSEGGVDSQTANAAWLATRGAIAVVCATTNEDADPAATPLETFCEATRFAAGLPGADARCVIGWSISKGSEGLLAAAGRWDLALAGLVLVSPSDRVWQAVGPDGPVNGLSSWSVDGEAVPCARVDGARLMPQLVSQAWHARGDQRTGRVRCLELRGAYDRRAEEGLIAVERVAAPVLTVAGSRDALWDSASMSQAIAVRRARTDDVHLTLDGAGHLITLGPGPVATRVGGIALGGEPVAAAIAREDFADAVTAFLGQCGLGLRQPHAMQPQR